MELWIIISMAVSFAFAGQTQNPIYLEMNCPTNESYKHSQENKMSLIFISKFNKKLSTYELMDKFDEPLRTLTGILIHSAVSEGMLDVVRTLLSLKADVDISNRNGITPLYKALEENRADMADLLMSCGADPNFAVSSITLLHNAVLLGDKNVLQQLILLKADLDPQDVGGKTPLYYAVEFNRTAIVPILLKAGANVNVQNDKGRTLLHIAVQENRFHVANSLIQLGIDVDVADNKGRTPLYCAMAANHSIIESLLLDAGADINFVSTKMESLLHTAVAEGDIHVVDKLMKLNVNVSMTETEGLSPVHIAIRNNNIDMLSHLLRNYFNVNELSLTTGGYPIHYAIQHGAISIVKTLLELGALRTVITKEGFTPLVHAIFLHKFNITKFLLGYGRFLPSDLNYNTDRNYNKPLHRAVLSGDKRSVLELLECGANPNATNRKGDTALSIAVGKNDLDVIDVLLSNQADARYKNLERGETLMHIAVGNKALNATRKLLEIGLAVDSVNNRGKTPLFEAIILNDTDHVKLLISKGADVNFPLVDGSNPLLTAISNSTLSLILTLIKLGAEVEPKSKEPCIERAVILNRPDVVKILISKGVNIMQRKSYLLHLATEHESIDVILLLLRLGVPVDIKQANKTPLWVATSKNKLHSMKTLLEEGADMNEKSFHPFSTRGESSVTPTWTLLHEAVFLDLVNATGLLLDHGFDPDSKDYRGWTPLHYATIADKVQTADLLLSRGADVSARTKNGIAPLDLVTYSKDLEKVPMVRVLKEALQRKESRQQGASTMASRTTALVDDSTVRNSLPPPFFVY